MKGRKPQSGFKYGTVLQTIKTSPIERTFKKKNPPTKDNRRVGHKSLLFLRMTTKKILFYSASEIVTLEIKQSSVR